MPTLVLSCNLGEQPVMGGELRLSARGQWIAAMSLAGKVAPTGPATLKVKRERGTIDSFVGTIRFSAVAAGSETITVDLVGGRGLLTAPLPFRDTIAGATPPPAGMLLRSIVDDAGEQLAAGVETALDAFSLARWTRAGGLTGVEALDLLCDALGLSWRVQPDGLIWAGVETWPQTTARATALNPDPADGSLTFGPDGAPLLPGTTIGGFRAVSVEYLMAGSALRATVRKALPSDPARVTSPLVYREVHAATVRKQNDDGDGTLDLVADDLRLQGDNGLLAVPLRVGGPGLKAEVPAGTRVQVAFLDGRPDQICALSFEQDAASNRRLALVGDSVGALLFTPPATLEIVPVGTPGSVSLTILGPGHRYLQGVPR